MIFTHIKFSRIYSPARNARKYVLPEKKSTFTVGHLNSIVVAESIEFIMMGNKRSIDIHLLLGMPDTDIDFLGNLYKCFEVISELVFMLDIAIVYR